MSISTDTNIYVQIHTAVQTEVVSDANEFLLQSFNPWKEVRTTTPLRTSPAFNVTFENIGQACAHLSVAPGADRSHGGDAPAVSQVEAAQLLHWQLYSHSTQLRDQRLGEGGCRAVDLLRRYCRGTWHRSRAKARWWVLKGNITQPHMKKKYLSDSPEDLTALVGCEERVLAHQLQAVEESRWGHAGEAAWCPRRWSSCAQDLAGGSHWGHCQRHRCRYHIPLAHHHRLKNV